jgi:hypothetical protein
MSRKENKRSKFSYLKKHLFHFKNVRSLCGSYRHYFLVSLFYQNGSRLSRGFGKKNGRKRASEIICASLSSSVARYARATFSRRRRQKKGEHPKSDALPKYAFSGLPSGKVLTMSLASLGVMSLALPNVMISLRENYDK